MEITIYAKKRTTSDGRKTFYSYLTTLTRNDGSPCTCGVKFAAPAEAPDPLDCPLNVIIEKGDCNMAEEKYINSKTGEESIGRKLWIKNYKQGSPYVDHSMDEFF